MVNEDRFVIVLNKCDVSVLDMGHEFVEEEGNALLFSLDFEDNYEVANYVAQELDCIVSLLNEQDKMLKSKGII